MGERWRSTSTSRGSASCGSWPWIWIPTILRACGWPGRTPNSRGPEGGDAASPVPRRREFPDRSRPIGGADDPASHGGRRDDHDSGRDPPPIRTPRHWSPDCPASWSFPWTGRDSLVSGPLWVWTRRAWGATSTPASVSSSSTGNLTAIAWSGRREPRRCPELRRCPPATIW